MAEHEELTLVVRKPSFGLPTGCPICLHVYIYLKFAKTPFQLDFNNIFPDSDQIPYVESGRTYMAYNNEEGGVIECLNKDGIVDLDTEFGLVSDWTATKAMVNTWLADALMYELWLGTNGTSASKIYYSNLPWPIGKILFLKKKYTEKLKLGIAKINSEIIEGEIYKKARLAYGALSDRLGEQKFLFENSQCHNHENFLHCGPSSLDAIVLAHVLFTLQALPETSVLQSIILEHEKLVNYAEIHKTELLEAGSSFSVSQSSADPSSATRRGPSNWSSKPKTKPKRENRGSKKNSKGEASFFWVPRWLPSFFFCLTWVDMLLVDWKVTMMTMIWIMNEKDFSAASFPPLNYRLRQVLYNEDNLVFLYICNFAQDFSKE